MATCSRARNTTPPNTRRELRAAHPARIRRRRIRAGWAARSSRRVFGGVVFRAREHVAMPAPGDTGPARLEVELHDTLWEALYAPVIRLVDAVTARVNQMQFLTIRRYLTLVVSALVLLDRKTTR